jgi:hypothetical protein
LSWDSPARTNLDRFEFAETQELEDLGATDGKRDRGLFGREQ